GGASGCEVAALRPGLREGVAAMAEGGDASAVTRLFEWLTTVALDAFASAGMQSLRERQAEQLESGTPVIEVLPRVPAVLVVGAPSTVTIDSLLARAWMLAVGTGAPCLIIDCAGLAEPGEKSFEAAYRAVLAQ